MNKKIYGVDPDKKVTPLMVRDAIIRCFTEAHADVLETMKDCADNTCQVDFDKIKSLNIRLIINKFFEEAGGDFENPTREDLIAVCDKLAEFSQDKVACKAVPCPEETVFGPDTAAPDQDINNAGYPTLQGGGRVIVVSFGAGVDF